MLREHLIHKTAGDGKFRWRSHEVSRLEGLSDAVFAFAITLLVVSLEVPRTFTELFEIMRGFVPFAVCFTMLYQIWYSQFIWFRRYGMQDTTAVTLNGVLLFVVLFYVYPLKFLFTYLLNVIMGGQGMVRLPNGRTEPMLQGADIYAMMVVYDAGFIAVFAVFVLLYFHAWRKRDELVLNADERFETIRRLGANACMAGVSLLSLAVVLIGGMKTAGWAGMLYFLIGPTLTVYHSVMGRRKRKADEQASLAGLPLS